MYRNIFINSYIGLEKVTSLDMLKQATLLTVLTTIFIAICMYLLLPITFGLAIHGLSDAWK